MNITDWYLFLPLLGGIGVALISGPFGAFIVWRRLAYFGDTLSHSGLLGVTLALAFHFNVTLGVCAIALLVAISMLFIQSRLSVASDTLLGILSHTSLALGLLALAAFQEIRVDVLGFLYGDILSINIHDVIMIYLGGMLAVILLIFLWPSMLLVTLSPDLAKVEGLHPQKIQAVYMILLAILIAFAIKIVGVLLITALLIIPAASARPIAKSPEMMAVLASIIGVISVIGGIGFSHFWDIPTGPTIVVISSLILALMVTAKKFVK